MLTDVHYIGKAHGRESSCLSHSALLLSVVSAGARGGAKSNNRRCKRVVADWKFVVGEGREEGVH